MDALDRVKQIRHDHPCHKWEAEDFRLAANRARKLWQTIQDLFGIQYGMLRDAVAVIAPEFELTDSEASAIREFEVASICLGRQIATSFVKWERCPVTSGIDNPFEPLLEIFEHGGYVNKEHGQFIDIFDDSGKPVDGLFVRQA